MVLAGPRQSGLQKAPVTQPGGAAMKRQELVVDRENIALFNPATKKADRSGVKRLEDGRKVRIFKANGEQVEA